MSSRGSAGTGSFKVKLGAATALVLLADQLIYSGLALPGLGVFALCWTVVLLIARWRAIDRRWAAVAAAFALIMFEAHGALAWLLFSIALTSAVLTPRVMRFDEAWSWCGRLVALVAGAVVTPLRDLRIGLGVRRRRLRTVARESCRWLWLPLFGSATFAALFVSANPLLSTLLARLDATWPGLDDVFRAAFWLIIFSMVWSLLRPLRLPADTRPRKADAWQFPGATPRSVRAALVCFNLLFAVQNGLDVAFLWSGAALPAGVTMAEYAHQGAYLLVLTALLAGAFVVLALRPGTLMARDRTIRTLVGLWTAQNLVLVASSMLRTIDYISVFSLTVLRIAALAWMGLVALGLVLIAWRLIRERSTEWLINANALAAASVLSLFTVVDAAEIAAWWNVQHAREVGGKGAPLDLCYLSSLGASALLPLTGLAQRTVDDDFGDRVRYVQAQLRDEVARAQRSASWSWRDQRRLDSVARLLVPAARPLPEGGWRDCDGSIGVPTPVTPPAAAGAPAPALPNDASVWSLTEKAGQ